jgi:hypothetical protein
MLSEREIGALDDIRANILLAARFAEGMDFAAFRADCPTMCGSVIRRCAGRQLRALATSIVMDTAR